MKIITKSKYTYFLLSMFSFFLLLPSESNAIPAFARKYKTSCATCHIAVSKRNAFGEAFRRNGYVMPKLNSRLVKEQPVKLGAEAWKEVWPEAVWPSDLPGSAPVCGITQVRTEYTIGRNGKNDQLDFNMPFDFSLAFGGAFGEDIGFFGVWSNSFGLNRLFVVFNDVFGPKNMFNIKAGAFPVGITDGYLDNQRLTMTQTALLSYSPSGDWQPNISQAGLELFGIAAHNFQYNIGVVNGEGRTRSDLSNDKDYYSRIAYKFGGYDLDGYDFSTDSSYNDFYDETSLTLGIYGYFGNTRKTASGNKTYDNKFDRIGADLRFTLGHLDLLAGLISGIDWQPTDSLSDLKSLVSFVEADYSFYPWLIGILRLEQISANYKDIDIEKCYRIVPNVCILIRQNVRLSAEAMLIIYEDKKYNELKIAANNDKPLQWLKMNLMFAF